MHGPVVRRGGPGADQQRQRACTKGREKESRPAEKGAGDEWATRCAASLRRVSKRQPTGPPPPPAVQKLRLRYTKRGRLRFTSHRDIARAFERALRRAEVPMAYSAGFSPHPKISWVGAAPTGGGVGGRVRRDQRRAAASTSSSCGPRSTPACPTGIDVVEVVEAPGRAPACRTGSRPRTGSCGCRRWRSRTAQRAVEVFLAADEVLVERLVKDGRRDARRARRRRVAERVR